MTDEGGSGNNRTVTVVTGATSGLGLETVKSLANKATGQVIVIACRSLVKAKTAIDSITSLQPDTELRGIELDLSDLESVRICARELRSAFTNIDCLICNAGVLIPGSNQEAATTTKDGFEINVGTNHLGHVLLIHLLTDLLDAGRVIIVSSILLKSVQKLNLNLLRKINQSAQFDSADSSVTQTTPGEKENYCQSKLMNALFAQQLSKRFPNLHVYCVSPGWCKTQLHRNTDIPWYAYIGIFLVGPILMKSARQGCRTIVHCATEPLTSMVSGKFYRNDKVDDGIEEFLSNHFPDSDFTDEFYKLSKYAVLN